MKNKNLLYILTVFILTISCYYKPIKVITENDNVKSIKRIKTNFFYHKPIEKNTSFESIDQKIVREIHKDGSEKLSFFDIVTLNENSLPINNKIFFIVDDEPNEISIEKNTIENSRSIEEKTDDLLTADSTKVSVITGYTQYNQKKNKLLYTISAEITKKIKNAKSIKIRYYTNFEMITVVMTKNKLDKLKLLLAEN